MKAYSKHFKRVLALAMTFVMAVSVITVTPSMNVSAASNKVVKNLTGVAKAKTMTVGQTATFQAKVKATKKVSKKLLQVTVKSNKKNIVSAKVSKSPKKNGKSGASTIALTAKSAGTAVITVTTKAKNKKNKKVVKKMTVTVEEAATSEDTTTGDTTKPEVVKVSGVTLDAEALNLDVNKGSTLNATVTPLNATNKAVTWTSSNTAVATVDANGTVKAVAVGEAVITVTTSDGGYQAQCKVTVKDSSVGISDGMEMTVTNALEDYSDKAKGDYVCLAGSDAAVRVKVSANGKPYTNQKVNLSLTSQYGNASGMYKIYGKSMSDFDTTDENGYVEFTISRTDDYNNVTATSGRYQSYSLKAVASGLSTEATLSFGTVSLVSPEIVWDDENGTTNLEPGENAKESGDEGYAYVKSKGNAYNQEYVTSQQVSASGVNHSVTMATYPVIDLPRTASDVKTGAYKDTSFAKKSGEYSVYNDDTNVSTTTVIDTIPAGLEWATVYFDEMVLSEYTKLVVAFYKLNEDGTRGDLIEKNERTATNIDKDALSMQIPVQEDVAVCAIIALYSEGQVNDDSNAGYVVNGIEGEWASTTQNDSRSIAVKNSSVTWNKNNNFKRASDDKFTLTYEEAKAYLPSGTKYEQYLNSSYTYSYNVPAFPSVGNAVITVKDANNNVKAYFAYPIVNVNNTNDIKMSSTYHKAVLIGSDEYNNQVGTIKTKGAFVTVDSTKTGYTPLVANINLDSLGVSISNPDAYSYIQWAPAYEQEVEQEADDFYALEGQSVKVTAQLYDATGTNKVTQAGKNLSFSIDNGRIDNFVTNKDFETSTDSNGTLTFSVEQTKTYDYIKNLSATVSGYQVKFTIGGKEVEKATIHWIEPGMYYKNAVGDATVCESYDNKASVQTGTRTVGNNWIFGMKIIGQIDAASERKGYAVTDIQGITIDFKKDGVGTLTTGGYKNGQAGLTSDETGASTLIGSISSKNVTDSSKVVFTIAEVDDDGNIVKVIGKFNNVGDGTPTMTASITLNVDWASKGVKASVVLPMGTQLDVTTPSKVYIQVVDEYGNKLSNKAVTYSLSGLGAITAKVDVAATTDANGLVPIELAAPGETGSVSIKAVVAGVEANGKITYTSNGKDAFSVEDAVLDKEKGTVSVTFSNLVNVDTVSVNVFNIVNGDNSVKIKSAKVDSNQARTVVLTLEKSDDLTNVDADNLTLEVKAYVKDGVEYLLMDDYNQIITGTSKVTLSEK